MPRRTLQRRAHLAEAVVLFGYVYLPLGDDVELIARFAAFPLLVLSGIAMWQWPRILRLIRARQPPGA